jgi:hypothetical protein
VASLLIRVIQSIERFFPANYRGWLIVQALCNGLRLGFSWHAISTVFDASG